MSDVGHIVFNLRDNLCGWGFHGKQRGGLALMDILQKLKNWKPWATGGQKIVLEETIAEIEELRKRVNELLLTLDAETNYDGIPPMQKDQRTKVNS